MWKNNYPYTLEHMYEPLEVAKCEKCRKVIADQRVMKRKK